MPRSEDKPSEVVNSLPSKYIAIVGLDYRARSNGKPVRVEAGEEVLDLDQKSVDEEVRAGNIRVVMEQEGAPDLESTEEPK